MNSHYSSEIFGQATSVVSARHVMATIPSFSSFDFSLISSARAVSLVLHYRAFRLPGRMHNLQRHTLEAKLNFTGPPGPLTSEYILKLPKYQFAIVT